MHQAPKQQKTADSLVTTREKKRGAQAMTGDWKSYVLTS